MSDELKFNLVNSEWELDIENKSQNPLSFSILPVSSDGVFVPLALVSESEEYTKVYINFTTYAPTSVEAGESQKVKFAVRRQEITSNEVSSLLKVSDDLGNRFFIPIWAEKLTTE
jgi:hypothetical protein